LPDEQEVDAVTQADFAKLGTCPELQVTGAAVPPAQEDPDVQG